MFVTFVLQGLGLWQGADTPSLIDLALALLDAAALAYWLLSRRLRACFDASQQVT
jgi:hypothetical protein